MSKPNNGTTFDSSPASQAAHAADQAGQRRQYRNQLATALANRAIQGRGSEFVPARVAHAVVELTDALMARLEETTGTDRAHPPQDNESGEPA